MRPSSLPPELGDLDFKWDDDLASPAPHRSEQKTLNKLELDLDLEEGERPTAIPVIPMDEFVARAMAEADHQEQAGANHQAVQRFDMRTRIPLNPPPLAVDAGSYPPTLASSVVPSAVGSEPAAAQDRQMDPLSVDLADMDIVRPETHLGPPRSSSELQPGQPTTERSGARSVESEFPADPPSQTSSRSTMKDRYAMGDFTGALEIAEALLSSDSADLEAQRYATSCRDVLMQMYLSRLGGLEQVINVVLPPEELRWLNLDHRAGFLLSLVDGASSIEELLDISGMPRLDALRILATLAEQRAILLGTR